MISVVSTSVGVRYKGCMFSYTNTYIQLVNFIFVTLLVSNKVFKIFNMVESSQPLGEIQ